MAVKFNNPAGSPHGAIRELTEAKRRREIAHRRESTFAVIADSTPMAMMIHRDERWLYINRAAETITEYSVAELRDMHFLDIVHPDYRKMVMAGRSKEGYTSNRLEFKIQTRNGQDRWVSGAEILTLIDDRPAGVISVFDITDRKQAEEALRVSEEKYRLLVETATDVIFTIDARLRITYIKSHSEANFSHGLCPECIKRLYPTSQSHGA